MNATDDAKAALMSRMGQVVYLAMKVKSALLKRGKRKGWTKCPRCGGKVSAVLLGKKDYLHMACETPDCIRMME